MKAKRTPGSETMSQSSPLRILVISPVGVGVNPYVGLFCDGLTAAGADVHLAPLLASEALTGGRRPDVIHLHWLDHYDLPPGIAVRFLRGARDLPRRAVRRLVEGVANAHPVYQVRRWLRLRRLFSQLVRFQRQGGRVAFTVHNLQPHEDAGFADRWGMAEIIRRADVIHVHDVSTVAALEARFGPRRGVVVAPHGHYLTAYPNEITRLEARARAGAGG